MDELEIGKKYELVITNLSGFYRYRMKDVFLQPETYLLYRDLLLMKGYSVGQLKPVNVISNEMQRKFFFGLQEDFDELKRK